MNKKNEGIFSRLTKSLLEENLKKCLFKETTCVSVNFYLSSVDLLLTELSQHVVVFLNQFQDVQCRQMT